MKNKLLILCIMILISSIFTPIAKAYVMESDSVITPFYTTIVLCYNNLKLNSGGKFSCTAETSVQRGYIAGVKMELQKLSDNWTTIKTWNSTSEDNEMYLYKEWYVEKGTYRLKLTHTALDSSNNIVETVIKYSNTVIY